MTPELAIRLARAAFNTALAEADLHTIGPILAPDVVLIAGTDSAVISGRKAQLLAWKRDFASPDRTIYLRRPDTITLSAVEPIALEQGHWQGTWSSDGGMLASGIYSAKWRQIGPQWVIEAEIYLTLSQSIIAHPKSVLQDWLSMGAIGSGPIFRRVIVRRYAAQPARPKTDPSSLAWNARWAPERFAAKEAVVARTEEDVGQAALHPGSVTPILRSALSRAFKAGAFPDLDQHTFGRQLKEVSAHSTRVGVNQDYFASGEDLAGIMDALRWKSPRMPLFYNRNLAAEQGAAGRLLGRIS